MADIRSKINNRENFKVKINTNLINITIMSNNLNIYEMFVDAIKR